MAEVEILTPDKVKEQLVPFDPDKSVNISLSDKDVQFEYDDGYSIKAGKKTYAMTDEAVDTALRLVGLPARNTVLKEFPNLVVNNLNYVRKKMPTDGKVLIRNGNVVAMNKHATTLIRNEEIIEEIEKQIPEVKFDQVTQIKPEVFSIHAFNGNGSKIKVAKDDYFKAGVNVVNSPIGIDLPVIGAYGVRLACTNGQIATDEIWKAGKDYEDGWLGESVGKAYTHASKFIDSIKVLKELTINPEHIEDLLHSLYKDLHVPEKLREYISNRIAKEGASNMYDLMNHMTYVASHYKVTRENPLLMHSLMRSGGSLVQHHQTCGSCHRILAN